MDSCSGTGNEHGDHENNDEIKTETTHTAADNQNPTTDKTACNTSATSTSTSTLTHN